MILVLSSLNKLDTTTKGTNYIISNLAAFGMLYPQAFGLLNLLVPLVLASNHYIAVGGIGWPNQPRSDMILLMGVAQVGMVLILNTACHKHLQICIGACLLNSKIIAL